MPLRPASLLLLGATLGIFVPGGCCDSPSHSLRYYYLHLPEASQGLPQFLIRGYLDEQPIARFDSLTRKMEPLVPWMEEKENEKFLALEWIFSADLKKLSQFDHPIEGFPTWQAILGCELREDGSKGGYFHYGYDGMDFISFDKETLRWVAAQPQAQKVKEEWEDDTGWSENNKIFLEETCIEGLQRYQSYRKRALKKTGWWIPVGIVAGIISGAVILLIWWWKRGRKVFYQKVRSSSDDVPSEVISSSPTCGTDNEIQLESTLQSKITSDDETSYRGRGPQMTPEVPMPTLRRRQWKQRMLKRSNSWAGDWDTLAKAGATESEERARRWIW